MSAATSRFDYLNTDLDLIAARDLTPLVTALVARGLIQLDTSQGADGRWYSRLEAGADFDEPEPTIRALLDAIEAIDAEAKQLWAECSTREFNIGYDCGDEPSAFNTGLTNSTLNRMADVGASLRITLYPRRAERK